MSHSDITNRAPSAERTIASFDDGAIVQLALGCRAVGDAEVEVVAPSVVRLTDRRVVAVAAGTEWSWHFADVADPVHGDTGSWTLLPVPGVTDHGVAVRPSDARAFREQLDAHLAGGSPVASARSAPPAPHRPVSSGLATPPSSAGATTAPSSDVADEAVASDVATPPSGAPVEHAPTPPPAPRKPGGIRERLRARPRMPDPGAPAGNPTLAGLVSREVSAWFGSHHVLDRVSLEMPAGQVTALIGPSGCGKSTYLRILNRMHEMVPSASMAGAVLLDGADIYDADRRLTDARREVGMVFQKPNPFPAMSIYDNVVASFRLTGHRADADERDEVVETCLRKAGLWNEVRDRLRQPGGGLSGGQQQRLCIARALAIKPRVLLMDEPCSALDPTSTRRIEQTITELASEVTIVIVTHNMQQAARVSHRCAFFLAEQGAPGAIVEHGPTDAMFGHPRDPRTDDYVNGRFG